MPRRHIFALVLSLVFAGVSEHLLLAQGNTVPSYPPSTPSSTVTTSVTPPATTALPPANVTPAPPATSVTPPGNTTNPPATTAASTTAFKVFGRDLFRAETKMFEIPEDAPVPPDYLLGTGDRLAVVCWYGSTEYEHADVTISTQGEIYLHLLGTLPLSGKTITQAEHDLRARYARFYTRFDLKVQLVGRRTIPVFVMGEVVKPNKYLLSSLATVFTALFAASGPSDIGSMRRIRVLRNRTLLREIDIYDFLLKGELVDIPLQAGDIVFVPPAGKVVTVSGEVRRPAKYELIDADTLETAMRLAGGPTSTSVEQIRLTRVDQARKRVVEAKSILLDDKLALRDGDEIYLHAVLPMVVNAITLTGAVYRPGEFPIEKAPTVSALLKLADGVTTDAYLEQAILERLQEQAYRIKLTVDLHAILSGQPGADLRMQSGDRLTVYHRGELTDLRDVVRVDGEVVKPGEYPFRTGMRVADLLNLAFGVTAQGYMAQALLYHYPHGHDPQLQVIDLSKALDNDAKTNLSLQPRDRLVVKSRSDVTDLAVQVEGEVARPGSLPFYAGMTVADAIFLTGGMKPNVSLDRALLIRLDEKTLAEDLREVNLRGALAHEPAQNLPLCNKDRLLIFPSDQMGQGHMVTVEGAVVDPGHFPYVGQMRVSHLLFLAKGLRRDAFPTRADLYRLHPDNTVEIIPVNLTTMLRRNQTDTDPLLMPRDRLVVSTREAMQEPRKVKVDGYVRHPGSFDITEGMKLSDLLHLAGNVKPEADLRVNLYRMEQGKARTFTYPLTQHADGVMPDVDPLLEPNDLVSVLGNAEFVNTTETVAIDGEVLHPGAYPAYHDNRQSPKTLYELIVQAGNPLPTAYPNGIVLYRKAGAMRTERQEKELTRTMSYLDAIVGIPTVQSPAPAKPVDNDSTTPANPADTNSTSPANPLSLAKSDPATITPVSAGTAASVVQPILPSVSAAAATADNSAPKVTGGQQPATTPTIPVAATDQTANANLARAQNITSLSKSLAQVLMTDQGNTVVLVVPPRSMQEQEFSQSVPVDAEPILRSHGKQGDITLEPGDYLYVPKRPMTVTVIGGVVNNGSVVYEPGKSFRYYLSKVGGISPDGDDSHLVVMRLNGLVMPEKQVKAINPGDIIIVPTKHLLRIIHTKGTVERSLQIISETAISYLPFKN